MGDWIDRSVQEQEAYLANALALHRRQQSESPASHFCRDEACGEPIPTARRLAVPGVQYCADCAQRIESLKRANR